MNMVDSIKVAFDLRIQILIRITQIFNTNETLKLDLPRAPRKMGSTSYRVFKFVATSETISKGTLTIRIGFMIQSEQSISCNRLIGL